MRSNRHHLQTAVRAGIRDGGAAAAAQVLRACGRVRPRQVRRARQQRLLRSPLPQGRVSGESDPMNENAMLS